MTVRIVAAACRRGDLVLSLPPPARHHTIMHALDAQMIDPMVYPDDQGFLTSEGAFVGRRDAARIAVAAGQVAAPKWGPDLFSEDLW